MQIFEELSQGSPTQPLVRRLKNYYSMLTFIVHHSFIGAIQHKDLTLKLPWGTAMSLPLLEKWLTMINFWNATLCGLVLIYLQKPTDEQVGAQISFPDDLPFAPYPGFSLVPKTEAQGAEVVKRMYRPPTSVRKIILGPERSAEVKGTWFACCWSWFKHHYPMVFSALSGTALEDPQHKVILALLGTGSITSCLLGSWYLLSTVREPPTNK